MKIRNPKNFWSGVMFFALGLGFALFAQKYDMGSAQRMGPAYFPTVLGALLALLGLGIAIGGLAREGHDGKIDRFHLGPVAWIIGAIVAFGVLLRPAGLVVALVALVTISMLGSHEFKWKEAAAVSLVMGVIVYLVFIYGLKLTIPVWPAFIEN
ncbi:MAG: tripartite tricarboxylate transporter TctB family protein [Pseudomonadota bacterium]